MEWTETHASTLGRFRKKILKRGSKFSAEGGITKPDKKKFYSQNVLLKSNILCLNKVSFGLCFHPQVSVT